MRYAGSKARHGAFLKESILPHRKDGQRFIEPFCGSLGATIHLFPDEASDASSAVIKMHNAIKTGWLPRIDLMNEEYFKKHARDDTPEGGFLSHGCSFGGAYASGFAKAQTINRVENYVIEAINSAWKRANICKDVEITCKQYYETKFYGGELVYCDPPYAGVSQPYATTRTKANEFDSDAFWDWVKYSAEKYDAKFFISEYTAPDWAGVHNQKTRTDTLRSPDLGGKKVQEIIYSYGDIAPMKHPESLF